MAQDSIGPYTFAEQIGQGGFAAVLLATDDEGKPVAVKHFITDHGVEVDMEKVANERAVLERLDGSPHILTLRDVVEDDRGVDALVLEYCEGGDLIRRMVRREQGGPADEAAAFGIWRQIVDGVAHMHACGVAHLDLKPQNVLLTNDADVPHVKLCDFSHSYIITAGAPLVPSSQVGAGKYMAPEVALGERYDGKLADCWSCGVILYTLLTGALPFADADKIGIAEWRRVEWFSAALTALFESIFVVRVDRRIAAADLLSSPWARQQLGPSPPASRPPGAEVGADPAPAPAGPEEDAQVSIHYLKQLLLL